MQNIKNFLSKYKIWILVGFLAIFFFRSCARGRQISKLEKSTVSQTRVTDSLQSVINVQSSKIDSFPEVLRYEKLSIYLKLDDTISRVDRSPQLMEFHKLIKNEVKYLQK